MAKIDKIKVGSTTYSILDSVTAQIVCDNEESGNTASRTYTKGEYVKINDNLYKTTAIVASGGTLTEGVNITETNVGDELSALTSDLTVVDISSQVSCPDDSGITPKAAKIGRIITVMVEFTPANYDNFHVLLSGLPAPLFTTYLSVGAGGGTCSCKLDNTGNLVVYYPQGSPSGRIDAQFTYISES